MSNTHTEIAEKRNLNDYGDRKIDYSERLLKDFSATSHCTIDISHFCLILNMG